MSHWLLVTQDIWWVIKWILPPSMFIYIGMNLIDGDPFDVDVLPIFFLGMILYIAAVLGWWV